LDALLAGDFICGSSRAPAEDVDPTTVALLATKPPVPPSPPLLLLGFTVPLPTDDNPWLVGLVFETVRPDDDAFALSTTFVADDVPGPVAVRFPDVLVSDATVTLPVPGANSFPPDWLLIYRSLSRHPEGDETWVCVLRWTEERTRSHLHVRDLPSKF
jgi:hypothetical protein